MTIDLDAYLLRIGHAGGRAPTLDTLRAILAGHTETIAFENLNPLLKWPVRLDVGSLQRKMVQGGRGGYCYEQNILLSHALHALGFEVTGLAARVLWNAAVAGAIPPRTHMLLRVDIERRPWLVDAGFGVMTPTGPLQLKAEEEQATPHEAFRLLADRDEFVMQTKIREGWRSLYRFDLQAQLLPDYELANWYVSTHPESRFVNGLMVARPAPGRRYTLLNNEFTVHHLNGGTKRRMLASATEIRTLLVGEFQLTLPDTPELDSALRRLIAPAR